VDPHEHWQRIYTKRRPTDVGWYESDPATSRRLVMAAVSAGARSVIDIGGGSSSLAEQLLEIGVDRVAVLDISEAGLAVARKRLGPRADAIDWIAADVTRAEDVGRFDVWHDRAAFHFLLDPEARRRYVTLAARTVPAGGTSVMATFSHSGPETCSGLPVHRWEPEELAGECGAAWQLSGSERRTHTTPAGTGQAYVYCVFERVA
jgi:SAM-dependent methyltransferase